jgi:hypothetical protein
MRGIWNEEIGVFAQVNNQVTLHAVVNGRRICDPKSMIGFTPLVFGENGIDMLSEGYRNVFIQTIDEKLIQELITITEAIIRNRCPAFTGHDLAKLYRGMTRL